MGEKMPLQQMFLFFNFSPEIRQEIYIHFFPNSTVRLKEQMLPQRTFVSGVSEEDAHYCEECDSFHANQILTGRYHDDVLEATRFLRSGGSYDFGEDPPTEVVALFMTCRQIHNEALPLFYREAHFHWSMRSRFSTELSLFQAQLPQMKHLSIDFSFLTNATEYRRRDDVHKTVDKEIGRIIKYIARHCRGLQTFALHLLSDYWESEDGFDFLHTAIEPRIWDDRLYTNEALARLKGKVRDTVSIISVGPERGYGRLRGAIAPLEKWKSVEHWHDWPDLSVNYEQAGALGFMTEDDRKVRMWYFVPKSSKAVDTPTPKPFEQRMDGFHLSEDCGFHDAVDDPEGEDSDTGRVADGESESRGDKEMDNKDDELETSQR